MPLKETLQKWSRLFGWPTKYLFGDDIFISYSRADGVTYAAGLADKLAGRGFTCRFDLWGTQPGKEMPKALKRSLVRSASLVLVGTPGAASSEHVSQEVARMKRLGRRIVPIVFDEVLLGNRVSKAGVLVSVDSLLASEKAAAQLQLTPALWAADIEGLPISTEDSGKLKTGEPAEQILNRIEKTSTFKRKDDRLRFATRVVGIILIVLIVAALLTTYGAVAMTERARAKSEEARQKTEEANAAGVKATLAEAKATDQEQKAAEAKVVADKQRELAETAKGQAVIARAEAEEQTKIAEAQRREATKQGNIAWSRNRLAQAERERLVGDDPFRVPLELAIAAYRRYPSTEADALLRYGIEGVPRSVACAREDENKVIQALAYGPGSKKIYALGPRQVYMLDAVTGQALEPFNLPEGRSIVRLSGHGTTTAAAFNSASGHSRIDVFDTDSHNRKGPSLLSGGPVKEIALSDDGRYVAALSDDRLAQVWRVGESKPTVSEQNSSRNFRKIALSHDGRYAAVVSENPLDGKDLALHVWDTISQQEIIEHQTNFCDFTPDAGSTCVVGLTFSSWGVLAFTTSDGVYFYNMHSPEPDSWPDPRSRSRVNLIRPTFTPITMMSFYGPQNFVAVGTSNGQVHLFTPGGDETWIEIQQVLHKTAVKFFSDVSTAGDKFFLLSVTADSNSKPQGRNTLHVWTVKPNAAGLTVEEAARLRHDDPVSAILSRSIPEGVQLVTASGSFIRLWQKSVDLTSSLRHTEDLIATAEHQLAPGAGCEDSRRALRANVAVPTSRQK